MIHSSRIEDLRWSCYFNYIVFYHSSSNGWCTYQLQFSLYSFLWCLFCEFCIVTHLMYSNNNIATWMHKIGTITEKKHVWLNWMKLNGTLKWQWSIFNRILDQDWCLVVWIHESRWERLSECNDINLYCMFCLRFRFSYRWIGLL